MQKTKVIIITLEERRIKYPGICIRTVARILMAVEYPRCGYRAHGQPALQSQHVRAHSSFIVLPLPARNAITPQTATLDATYCTSFVLTLPIHFKY